MYSPQYSGAPVEKMVDVDCYDATCGDCNYCTKTADARVRFCRALKAAMARVEGRCSETAKSLWGSPSRYGHAWVNMVNVHMFETGIAFQDKLRALLVTMVDEELVEVIVVLLWCRNRFTTEAFEIVEAMVQDERAGLLSKDDHGYVTLGAEGAVNSAAAAAVAAFVQKGGDPHQCASLLAWVTDHFGRKDVMAGLGVKAADVPMDCPDMLISEWDAGYC